jgi:hypothetical protein
MAFVRHRLAALIEVDPQAARKEIVAAFWKARACRADAASLLGCRRSTFMSWVERLGIAAELDQIEAQSKFEEWHHGKVGGAGCHKSKRSSKSSSKR